MRKLLSIVLAGTLSLPAFLSFTPDAAQLYVEKYASLAVKESVKSGIPASVILAQGILESNAGNSELTRRSNNHFGIKWNESMPYEHTPAMDDDYDKLSGKKIPSNFVVYSSTEESFQHHSEFLMHYARYRPLFKLLRTDYAGWSKGLQECSYATQKNYANSLVNLINKYKLDNYDIPAMLEPDDEQENKNFEVNNNAITMNRQYTPEKQPQKNISNNIAVAYTPAHIIDNAVDAADNSEGLFEIVSASTVSTKNGIKTRLKSVKKQVQPTQEAEGLYEIESHPMRTGKKN